MSRNQQRTFFRDFTGANTYSSITNAEFVATLQGNGTPTVKNASGTSGVVKLQLDSRNEDQYAQLSFGDILSFGFTNLYNFRIGFAVSGMDANSTASVGLASATNSTLTSISAYNFFQVSNLAAQVSTCDTSITKSAVSAGQTLTSAKFYEVLFDYSGQYLTTPLDNVKVRLTNSNGQLTNICASTQFNCSNYTGNVQPLFRIEKSTGTATPLLQVDFIEIVYFA